MSARRTPEAWPVGARVRELGPTITCVPVHTERPARTGTVVWSGTALSVVQWDGQPRPHPAHPPHDALVLTSWLEPAPAAEGEAPPTELLPPSPATAPTAHPRPALRLVSLGETDDLGALDPDPSSAPERTSR